MSPAVPTARQPKSAWPTMLQLPQLMHRILRPRQPQQSDIFVCFLCPALLMQQVDVNAGSSPSGVHIT
jgi:hypothetical protein